MAEETPHDMVQYHARMEEIKKQYGIHKYKNALTLSYLRAVQMGDNDIYRYTRKKLKKTYIQLGFDDNARNLDIRQCIAAVRQTLSVPQTEYIAE
jgi:hypothetical protein